MQITREQYLRIADSFPRQRGNVSQDNLQVINAILYVLEQGCKWRGSKATGASLPATTSSMSCTLAFSPWH
nr:transposase [Desulfocurvibacter africanus]